MGETLLSGLVRAGRRVDRLLVGEKRPERARELEERYGVAVVANVEAARKADTVALVVKPQDMADVLAEIAAELRPGQLLVSLAAGITTAFIESRVPEGVAVVRVMPNTPALVDEGMAAISPGSHCSDAAPRRGGGAAGLGRPGDPDPRAPAGRRHRDLRLRSGVHLLRRRVDDRGRRAPRPAAHHRQRARHPDPRRLGQDAARDRHPPDRAARAGHLARRHHRLAPCASWRSTGCAPRSWPPWRPRATARASSPRASEHDRSDTPDVRFWFDPVCPFAWMTSKWVRTVQAQRDYDVEWRFISLRLLNAHVDYDAHFPPEYEAGHTAGLRLLRVFAHVRDDHGPDAVARALPRGQQPDLRRRARRLRRRPTSTALRHRRARGGRPADRPRRAPRRHLAATPRSRPRPTRRSP